MEMGQRVLFNRIDVQDAGLIVPVSYQLAADILPNVALTELARCQFLYARTQ